MFIIIDNVLDKITMYRLVLYELIFLLGVAVLFGFLGILPFSPGAILFSTGIILFVSLVTNRVFAKVFEAPTNIESVYITALILALIITPFRNIHDLPFFFWAGVLSQASKYIFAIRRKHVFNPVAIAVVLTSFVLGSAASWWVGTGVMMPFMLVTGLLIVKKIQREDMLFTFFLMAIAVELISTIARGGNVFAILQTLIVSSSLLFFGFVMLTEPLTTPPTKGLQIIYGAIVGVLFSPQIHLGSIYSTPELALVVGNVFSYLVSPKYKLSLRVKEKLRFGTDIIDFTFQSVGKIQFVPGQYMEWTLPHEQVDSRGNRRYFTIASSPTEPSIRLGIKFNTNGSSFKKALVQLDEKTPILAGQLAGDFTLPDNKEEKLVFLAGGIGITPFRSMIKYCIDINEPRPIVLFYANKLFSEIAYADVFEEARSIGIKTVYTLTDVQNIPQSWQGKVGRITQEMIMGEVPDFSERTFYLSGPHAMVTAFEEVLHGMGIPQNRIKKDFFPGFV